MPLFRNSLVGEGDGIGEPGRIGFKDDRRDPRKDWKKVVKDEGLRSGRSMGYNVRRDHSLSLQSRPYAHLVSSLEFEEGEAVTPAPPEAVRSSQNQTSNVLASKAAWDPQLSMAICA